MGMLLFFAMGSGCFAQEINPSIYDELVSPSQSAGSDIQTASDYRPGILKHIVLFKYKQDVTQAQRNEVVNRFLALKSSKRHGESSPYIISIIEGVQNSREGVGGGFEQAFIVTFKSEGDRNYYVGRPLVEKSGFYDEAHDEFKQYVAPLLSGDSGALVFDFSPK
ncbi:Dabb family protein (plasmid) [Serratia nevei]|uniref:Dabb family protein n=1 Tax=Serratia nevei TaxID=2703794 RepID=UPI003F6C9A1B